MRCIFLSILLGLSFLLCAQKTVFYEHDTLVESIYNVNDNALQFIADIDDVHTLALYKAYYWFWLAIAEDDKLPMIKAQACLNELDLNEVKDPLLQVSLALITMRIALINKSYLSAIQPQLIIRRYFTQREMENCPYDRFLRGMYHYFVAYGRESSLFYRMCLLGWPKADADTGLSYLKEMTQSKSTMIASEACYFLGRIYLEYENNNEQAYLLFQVLNKKYPNNPIYADFLNQCK